ncbi:MAG: tetratricopeptide repeat protein [Saprospiraceae bacterium]
MKKTLSITALFLFALSMQAQTPNDKYVKAMEKAFLGMDTLQTSEQWLAASNNFERIAQKETKEWLPPYYVAFCQTMAFNMSKDASMHELFAKRAEEFVNKADALNPDNSEVYVLKSMVSGLFIRLNPMVNGQKYGPVAGMQLEKAKTLDPENPRAYMQEGATLLFTPPQWGGDKVKAKAMLEIAAAKYEAFKPASSIHPNWGEKSNDMFLIMANK